MLSVRGVRRAFGGLQALDEVSLDLAAGEILGVIGPNGAGKSTLFGVIAGEVAPQAGRVTFGQRDITGWVPERIARAGLVKTFQTSRPFGSMSFEDNVAIGALSRGGSMREARAIARECLERVGLGERADSPSHGASTGQRKRLEIARALATRPALLLLDEPFGGVDIAAVDALVALLQRLRADGLTILLIEHNLGAVRRLVDRLIAMHLGRRIAEGAPETVIADPRVVGAYLGTDDVAAPDVVPGGDAGSLAHATQQARHA